MEGVSLNKTYTTNQFALRFKKVLSGNSGCSRPFPHFELANFIKSRDFLQDVRSELNEVTFERKENDLFALHQTKDLETFQEAQFPALYKFRQFFKSVVRDWLIKVSGVQLNNDVAIASSAYEYCDTLLPHDDQLDGRKFAFVLYLTPNWNRDHGGQLILYRCDSQLNTDLVAKLIPPTYNTLVLFEVSERSWHMVNEVIGEDAKRLSLHGWFHTDRPDTIPIPPVLQIRQTDRIKLHSDITMETLEEWINKTYMNSGIIERMKSVFEEKSEISLIQFLQQDKYVKTMKELGKMDYKLMGPDNKRSIWNLHDKYSKNSYIGTLIQLLSSKAMAVLLSQWTGLELHSTDPDTPTDIECSFEISKVCRRCYTMIDDQLADETKRNGHCLDFKFFMTNYEWRENHGGFHSYVVSDQVDEVMRVLPVSNCADLVYREPDVIPFVKYVNCDADTRVYYLVSCSYYGTALQPSPSDEERDSNDSGSDEDEAMMSGDSCRQTE